MTFPSSPPPSRAFRPDVEGLRAIAVILVVAFHVGLKVIPGGFVGVDVFFVLSGFLITGLLVQEIRQTGAFSPLEFYARRARRLLPAATVVIVSTLMLSVLVFPPMELVPVGMTASAAAGYVSNFYFMSQSSNYFAGSTQGNPLLHTWSLSVEEQFYLVWPWLILVAFRMGRGRKCLAGVLTAGLFISFSACVWYTWVNQPTAFYAPHMRAWEFAMGGLCAMVPARMTGARQARDRVVEGMAGWLGLIMIGVSGVLYNSATEFPGYMALAPVAGTSLVLLVGQHGGPWSVGRLLSLTPLQWVGKRSYSWYLWHWPFLVVGGLVFQGAPVGKYLNPLLVLAALAIAAVSYRHVEAPWRHHPGRPLRARWSVFVGLATTCSLVILGRSFSMLAQHGSMSPQQKSYSFAVKDLPRLYDDKCVPERKSSLVISCTYGTPGGPVVVLFGDSHAAHWFNALEVLSKTRGWQLVVFIKPYCPTPMVTVQADLHRPYTECDDWREGSLESISSRHPSLVILSNFSEYVTGSPRTIETTTVSPATWGHGLEETLRRLTATGAKVAVIQDVPMMKSEVPSCLAELGTPWLLRSGFNCVTNESSAFGLAAAEAERRAVASVPGSSLLSFNDVLCTNHQCQPVVDGLIVYRDRNHLTATMSSHLAPLLLRELEDHHILPLVSHSH